MGAVAVVTDEHLALASTLPVANIGDAMERLGIVDGAIRPIWRGSRLCGRAFTILTAGGDNKAIHDHLQLIRPGDVVAIDGQAATHRALLGELIAGRIRARGGVGVVVDGAIRDAEELERMRFPAYARGVSPAGPYRNGPGRAGVPVAIGGVVVSPGDLIVGDGDGVAVVGADRVAEVLAAAAEKHRKESLQRDEIAAAGEGAGFPTTTEDGTGDNED